MNKEKYEAATALCRQIQRTTDPREILRLANELNRVYEYGATSDKKITCPICKGTGVVYWKGLGDRAHGGGPRRHSGGGGLPGRIGRRGRC